MNPLREWNRFWFTPISARPLGAFRIAFGLVFLANLAVMTYDLDYWFTDAGLLRGREALEIAGPYRPSVLNWVSDPTTVRIFFAATAAAAVAFTLGWQTRIMGVLIYLGILSINHRNVITNSGADTLVLVMTFYMMLTPCGAAYSLDARREARRRGTVAEPLILPWSVRLIQIQLCLIYFDTAVLKCNGSSWLNGTALHYVFHNTEVGRPALSWMTNYPLGVNLLTYSAVITEFCLAFLLWFRPTRRWCILAGVGLHTGILFAVNIPIFGEMMTACYLTFLAPDELDAVLRTLDPRRRLRRGGAGARASLEIPGRIDPPAARAVPASLLAGSTPTKLQETRP
jgi:hypothetical protein